MILSSRSLIFFTGQLLKSSGILTILASLNLVVAEEWPFGGVAIPCFFYISCASVNRLVHLFIWIVL